MGSPARNPQIVHFADYILDLQTAELRRNGTPITLQDQPFQILATLIEAQGRLVTREELTKRLWPTGTFVDFDQSLNRAVGRLREALGDDAEHPRFVETLPRRGYRFVALIRRSPDQSTLAVIPQRKEEEDGRYPNPQVEAQPTGFSTSRIVKAFTIALAILVFAFLAWTVPARFNASRVPSSTTPFRSLAVLPLENLSGNAEQDYFAAGMTAELITRLGQLSSIRVISRTSVMQYRGVRRSLPQVARELDVDAIVEGTVVRSGDRLRIATQLLDARQDRHLWAQSFESDLKDVPALQDKIASEIAKQVQFTLTSREKMRPSSERPVKPEAYEEYLRGEYLLSRMTPDSVGKAARYFEQAIERDPYYSSAYAKLAGSYQILGNMGVMPKGVSYREAASLNARALELDPQSAAAHAVRAWKLLSYDLDFVAAGAEFKRAVELNPNLPESRQGLGDYYATMGQMREAVLEVQRAREVDPLSVIVNSDLCRMLIFARRYEEALAQCKANADLNPGASGPYWWLGVLYAVQGMDAKAVSAFLRESSVSGDTPSTGVALERGARTSGLEGAWRAWLQIHSGSIKSGKQDPMDVAQAYAFLGNTDMAVTWLERAVAARSYGVTFIRVDPTFDGLRSDPRFVALLARLGKTDAPASRVQSDK